MNLCLVGCISFDNELKGETYYLIHLKPIIEIKKNYSKLSNIPYFELLSGNSD